VQSRPRPPNFFQTPNLPNYKPLPPIILQDPPPPLLPYRRIGDHRVVSQFDEEAALRRHVAR
jgi:hypothetical protein